VGAFLGWKVVSLVLVGSIFARDYGHRPGVSGWPVMETLRKYVDIGERVFRVWLEENPQISLDNHAY